MKKTEKPQSENVEATPVKKGGVMNQVEDSLKENLKVTPTEVTDALMRDAKQAVNYEIRKGFRSLINGFFKR
jgi:hypothetical protein